MKRRDFLASSAALPVASALAAFPSLAYAQQSEFNPRASETWRDFEVTTKVEILRPAGNTRIWLPVPSVNTVFQKTIDNTWSGNARTAKIMKSGNTGASMLYAEFDDKEKAPTVELVSRFATRDHAVSLFDPPKAVDILSDYDRDLYTKATEHMPTDGLVRKTALDITSGMKTDYEKAKAIYEWIVDNTFRDPKVRGCGTGNITVMLETGYFGGKCADLNALYVGLARSVGLPARDVYGVRVAKSAFGYRSLGASTQNITKAQHCRAEVYLTRFGWVPVDPADVRKVALEERAEPTTVNDVLVKAVRPKLFGAWEMNWLAFNYANDIVLPNATHGMINFFMYPQAETGADRLDSLDPDSFRYAMTAKELVA
jgi:transglutaminase-like putative cysteine protease